MADVKALRERAEDSFKAYCCITAPHLLLGEIHYEIMDWLQDTEQKHEFTDVETSIAKLLLIPRAHLKSKIMALYACWMIVCNPAITILYISAAKSLTQAQLFEIKNQLESRIHRTLWPELIHIQKNKREKWNNDHIAVDHPLRRARKVRDNTVSALSIDSKFTGHHYDLCIFDDVVDLANSKTPELRSKIALQVGMITAILNSGSQMVAAGTIYHPEDIYSKWEEIELPVYEHDANVGKEVVVGTRKRWDTFKRVVEVDGKFLWPRQSRDGLTEGFNMNVLAEKKVDLLIEGGNIVQFGCQYYMNPNMEGDALIQRNMFKYYNRTHLKYETNRWWYKGQPLRQFWGWDFAEGLTKHHDFSVLIGCGITPDNEVLILDIYKYRTADAAGQFKQLKKAHQKWWFTSVLAESNKAGKQLIGELNKLCKANFLGVKVNGVAHTSYDGSKEDRIGTVLNYRYINNSMKHPKGQAHISELEDQLVSTRPRFDDIKDALATALEESKPPVSVGNQRIATTRYNKRGGLII